jgi:hypothetical protein
MHLPDRFFTAEQQSRLKNLMGQWRLARDAGKELPPTEWAELKSLIEAETLASGRRAAALADSE